MVGPPPVLVVGGTDDRLFSVAELQRTADEWSGEAVFVDGAPHDLMLVDARREVVGHITAFLKELG